jgi:hypothetical protein
VQADLAAGAHAGLVSELPQLVDEHPERERLAGQADAGLFAAAVRPRRWRPTGTPARRWSSGSGSSRAPSFANSIRRSCVRTLPSTPLARRVLGCGVRALANRTIGRAREPRDRGTIERRRDAAADADGTGRRGQDAAGRSRPRAQFGPTSPTAPGSCAWRRSAARRTCRRRSSPRWRSPRSPASLRPLRSSASWPSSTCCWSSITAIAPGLASLNLAFTVRLVDGERAACRARPSSPSGAVDG